LNIAIQAFAIARRPTSGRREIDSDVGSSRRRHGRVAEHIQRTVQEPISAERQRLRPGCRNESAGRSSEPGPRINGPLPASVRKSGWLRDADGITFYREVLYLFLQRFVYRGQMSFRRPPARSDVRWRIAAEPCRRCTIYRPDSGDDDGLGDIFIGFAMLNKLSERATARCAPANRPEVHRLPRQIYLWSSAFLQSCYCIDPLSAARFE
jgi:hypothetical protein